MNDTALREQLSLSIDHISALLAAARPDLFPAEPAVTEVYLPTMALRFVVSLRTEIDQPVLQQAWIGNASGRIEWRRVPTVVETQ